MRDRKEVEHRISALLDELMDLVKPEECDDPNCTVVHEPIPKGPWMLSGWTLAADVTAEGEEDVETWTCCFRGPTTLRTQALGMAVTLVKWHGG